MGDGKREGENPDGQARVRSCRPAQQSTSFRKKRAPPPRPAGVEGQQPPRRSTSSKTSMTSGGTACASARRRPTKVPHTISPGDGKWQSRYIEPSQRDSITSPLGPANGVEALCPRRHYQFIAIVRALDWRNPANSCVRHPASFANGGTGARSTKLALTRCLQIILLARRGSGPATTIAAFANCLPC